MTRRSVYAWTHFAVGSLPMSDGGSLLERKMATIMRDHPAWATTDNGAARVMRSGASTWLVTCGLRASDVEMTVVDGPRDGPSPEVIRVDRDRKSVV